MKRVSAALIAALIVAAPVAAAPGDNSVTVVAKPTTVLFGKPAVVSGQLTGPGSAGETVDLRANPAPFGTGGFDDAGSTRSDPAGNYSFTVIPQLNTQYQTRAKTSPPTESSVVTVLVRPQVSMGVSDSTPDRGERVRFRGAVRPAHDGATIQIQKRTRTGYKTVATTPLLDAGDVRSVYSVRITIARNGLFRALLPAHDDHASGKSKRRRLDVED